MSGRDGQRGDECWGALADLSEAVATDRPVIPYFSAKGPLAEFPLEGADERAGEQPQASEQRRKAGPGRWMERLTEAAGRRLEQQFIAISAEGAAGAPLAVTRGADEAANLRPPQSPAPAVRSRGLPARRWDRKSRLDDRRVRPHSKTNAERRQRRDHHPAVSSARAVP